MTILVDANILLDVLIERQPFFDASAAVWALAETKQFDGVVSALSFSNVHYLARKSFGIGRATEAMKLIAANFRVATVDQGVIDAAITAGGTDFEDAIQALSGRFAGATHVVTRDLRGFARGPLIVVSPRTYVHKC